MGGIANFAGIAMPGNCDVVSPKKVFPHATFWLCFSLYTCSSTQQHLFYKYGNPKILEFP